jgi:hypothetical protein
MWQPTSHELSEELKRFFLSADITIGKYQDCETFQRAETTTYLNLVLDEQKNRSPQNTD